MYTEKKMLAETVGQGMINILKTHLVSVWASPPLTLFFYSYLNLNIDKFATNFATSFF